MNEFTTHYNAEDLAAITAAQTIIDDVMTRAERITEDAATEHLQAFKLQIREKVGIEEIALDEPYLPLTITRMSLVFLKKLDRLTQLLQQRSQKDFFYKAIFDDKKPLLPQVENRMAIETVRQQLSTKQVLDIDRQGAYGFGSYIWRTSGDDKVRKSHAEKNGKIFSWESDGPHPGQEPGCRCSAEPIIEGAGKAKFPLDGEQVADIVLLLSSLTPQGAARSIGTGIVRGLGRAGQRIINLVRRENPEPAPQPPKPESETAPLLPSLNDSTTWPKPPKNGIYKEGLPSRTKPRSRGEKSLYDEHGGEWRYDPGDKYHNPHWNYRPPGTKRKWENIPIGDLPPRK